MTACFYSGDAGMARKPAGGLETGTNYDMIKREMGDMMVNDTIYAPATPSGGAIAVIRISGPDAHNVLERVFRSAAEMKHAVMRHGGL